MRTAFQGGVVVGFDGQSHVRIRDGVVIWEDDRIVYVGNDATQPVDRTIQARARLIIPGFVNLHWHAGVRANWRLTSDHGDLQFFGAGFPNTDAGRRGVGYDMSEADRAIQFSNSIPMRASACAGWAANRRQAAAMLVWPAHLKSPMAVLRSAAITCGMLPQRT
jgi:hypothetical protein